MITTVRTTLVAFFATTTLATAVLPAQNVVLSEVRADAGERWVELHNRATFAVDLSSWSLHYATKTPSMPQEYWWAFPTGTVLGPGAFLRVHWFQAAPASPSAGDLWTGASPWQFLFGLGGEALSGTRGAFGLYRTQLGDYAATSTFVEDWLSWGDHGFSREPLAIAAGRWTANHHAPAIPANSSLARNEATIGTVAFHEQQWFVDGSPTPLEPNLSGALVTAHGQACAVFGHHLLGEPALRPLSLPLLGNAQFGLAVDNTTGIYGEYVLVAWTAAAAAPGTPSILPSDPGLCAQSVALDQVVALWLLPAQIVSTTVPLSLASMPASLVGSELHAQALVLDLLPYAWSPVQGLSNAVRIVFGQ